MTDVTVIMSVYNETVEQLEQSVSSILNQTLRDIKFNIVLDNPKNGVMKQQLTRIASTDPRVSFFVNNVNVGLAESLNVGLKNSTTTYVARMDADDVAIRDRLKSELDFLKSNPEIDVLSSNINCIDDDGRNLGDRGPIPTSDIGIKSMIPVGLTIFHPTVMYKRSAILAVGGYNNLDTCEDLDLWTRLSLSGARFAAIPEALLHYRIRANSMTSNYWRNYLYAKVIREFYKEHSKSIIAGSENSEEIREIVEQNGLKNPRKAKTFNRAYAARMDLLASLKTKLHFFTFLSFVITTLKSKAAIDDTSQYIRYRLRLKHSLSMSDQRYLMKDGRL